MRWASGVVVSWPGWWPAAWLGSSLAAVTSRALRRPDLLVTHVVVAFVAGGSLTLLVGFGLVSGVALPGRGPPRRPAPPPIHWATCS